MVRGPRRSLGAIDRIEHQPARAGASSHSYGKEIDLVSTYQLDAKTSVAFAAGMVKPDKGGREAIENFTAGFPGARMPGSKTYVLELFAFTSF